MHHRHWLALVVLILVIAGIAWLVTYLVTRSGSRRQPQPTVVGAGAGAPVPAMGDDSALATLRMRYARGEISRSDYLQTTADLGGPPVPLPPDPPPTAPV